MCTAFWLVSVSIAALESLPGLALDGYLKQFFARDMSEKCFFCSVFSLRLVVLFFWRSEGRFPSSSDEYQAGRCESHSISLLTSCDG
ncbi:hypothetical protein EMIT0P12_20184 [Pseudomonas sp. IT-P12]